jgi:membrane-bound acyltransferase YfiQ involved in biofilm formation
MRGVAGKDGTKRALDRTNGDRIPMEPRMSFLLYLVGSIVIIAGLAWLATVAGISQTYIMIGAVILLGIGISTAVTQTRSQDPS